MKRTSFTDKLILVLVYYLFVQGLQWIFAEIFDGLERQGILLPMFHGINLFSVYILVLCIILLIIVKLIQKKPFEHYGFKKFSKDDFNLMLSFVFLLMPLAFLGRLVAPEFDLWYANGTGLTSLSGLLLFAATMPFFVIKEELIVRSIFQNTLRSYGFWWMALAISAGFAIAHANSNTPMFFLIVWIVSVFIGSLFFLIPFYEMTKNIYLAILLHLIYNILVIYQIFLHVDNVANEVIFWSIMLMLSGVAFWKSWPRLKHFYSKLKFKKLPAMEIVFLVFFGIVYPTLLYFGALPWLLGVVLTMWIFLIKR